MSHPRDILRGAQAQAAATADWAPTSHGGTLEDRASYRYHWQVLERAHQTGRPLPDAAQGWFATPGR